jgi:hypothetical protein
MTIMPMSGPGETRYFRTPDGIYIAYQTTGEGPVDVAFRAAAPSDLRSN